jgi:hypothetical protein
MKKLILLLTLLISLYSVHAQTDFEKYNNSGEIVFSFQIFSPMELEKISNMISIDKYEKGTVTAYANENEFNEFLRLGYKYQILPHPGINAEAVTSDNMREIMNWNVYPTYEAYVQMMYQFESLYPNICKIYDAGTTVQGRKILFAKISDNVNSKEEEPQLLYSSTMHGDETTGYILMLRLIDSLLSTYGSNERITNLVNNLEIWINPNANPDGTYRGGNSSVSGATRSNANNFDINRNFPDPAAGQNPGGAHQPETIIMMNFSAERNTVLAANFHGGAEVVNYPWDTWQRLHPDDVWYRFISREYADTAHANAPSTYMTYLNNGITNGYAWYRITGGRQDFMNYYRRSRELTLEISNSKNPAASTLPNYWNYNRKSLLNFMEQALYGIRGKIVDQLGNPVKAKVTITGHDADNTEVFSDALNGMYYRPIQPGSYNLTFSADSFYTKTITGVTAANYNSTVLNVTLENMYIPVELTHFTASKENNKIILTWSTATEVNNKGFTIERVFENEAKIIAFIEGMGTTTNINSYTYTDNVVMPGKYIYKLNQIDYDGTINEKSIVEVDATIPDGISLEQNYPNPFNPSTRIVYTIGSNGGELVTLRIYDILGNEISTIVNEIQSPGVYEVSFGADNLTSGVYIYRLTAGEYSINKRMVLIK